MNCSKPALLLLAVVVLLDPSRARGDESLRARRQRLLEMSPSERQELIRKKQRFDGLSKADQKRLRQLRQQIEGDQRSEHWHQLMVRYNEWLKSLPAGERAELLSLPVAERIAKIKQIMQAQESQRFQRYAAAQLQPEDYRRIISWLHEFLNRHEAEIRSRVPEAVAARLDKLPPPQRRWILIYQLIRHQADDLVPQADDIRKLAESLSDEAQAALAKESNENQGNLVRQWIQAAIFSRGRGPLGMNRPPVSPDELKRFFHETLNKRDQAYLESLPSEQMRRELMRWYYFHQMGGQMRWIGDDSRLRFRRGSVGPAPRQGRDE